MTKRYTFFTVLFIMALLNSFGQIRFDAYISDNVESITFVNLSMHDIKNPYMLFYWKMGDGLETFAGNELVHYYEAPGKYSVSLIGITKLGTRDTFTKELRIPEDLEFITSEGEMNKRKTAQSLTNLKHVEPSHQSEANL